MNRAEAANLRKAIAHHLLNSAKWDDMEWEEGQGLVHLGVVSPDRFRVGVKTMEGYTKEFEVQVREIRK